jgi:hypothetical protein
MNRDEHRHSLARWIFFADQGEFRIGNGRARLPERLDELPYVFAARRTLGQPEE